MVKKQDTKCKPLKITDMKFYAIVNKRFDDSQFAYGENKEIDFNVGDAKYCIKCGNPISMLEWLPPYDVTVSKKRMGDFIYGTHVGMIVSESFKLKYEQTGLKGLTDFKKVDLYYRNKLLPNRYYYPEIDLLTAFVDLNRLKLDIEYLCPVCQRGHSILNGIDGIAFMNPDEIKDDIFFTSCIGQTPIIVSQVFKNFVEKNSFTNIKFVEASNYRWDAYKPSEY